MQLLTGYLFHFSILTCSWRDGKARAIGVANFDKKHLEELLSFCNTRPHVNQIECHTWLPESDLIKFCQSNGIHVEAYSPLGSGLKDEAGQPDILSDKMVQSMATKYRKSPAQVSPARPECISSSWLKDYPFNTIAACMILQSRSYILPRSLPVLNC